MTTTEAVREARVAKPPSEAQLRFAIVDLGLTIPDDAPAWQVTRMIKREVRRRGREVLRSGNYIRFTLVQHPKHGLCEIDRIGEDTLKVTLTPMDGGRKFVIDAMTLESCERVEE